MALNVLNEQGPLYPVISGSVVLSAQVGAIGSTPVFPSAPPGIYRMCVYVAQTATGSSGNLVINAVCTDDVGSQTIPIATISNISSATGYVQGLVMLENTATANINYSATVSGTPGSLTYNLYILLERLF